MHAMLAPPSDTTTDMPSAGQDVFHAGTTDTTNRDATDKMHSVLTRGPEQSGDISLSEPGVDEGE